MKKSRKCSAVLALVMAGVLTVGQGAALAAAKKQQRYATPRFDGAWSVVVITDWGTCDRAYRYPVMIENGYLRYDNPGGVTISGRVDGNGRLRAVISAGDRQARGTGRLGANFGRGTWSGESQTAACRGRWEAERRG